jgi:hypothetical protein
MIRQRGLSLLGLTITLGVLAFIGIMAAKLLPAYVDYWGVRKIFATMEKAGEFNAPPPQVRRAYDRRNAIEDVHAVQGKDLDISMQGGQTVVSADWSVKVPLVANISACLDFSASGGESAADSTQQ